MTFRKFSSLNNTYNSNIVERAASHSCARGEWIATEKVHGANFSFWYDPINGPRIASRTQFVDGSFYGCKPIFDKYVAEFVSYCNENFPNQEVVVYGELHGGNIQREVRYDQKDFIAFEVQVDGIPRDKLDGRTICYEMGFDCAPLIAIGTFEDCMAVSPDFVSYLANEHAPIELQFAEGLVIEPRTPSWTGNGSRVYFKHKSKSFQEKKDCTPKEPKKPVALTSPEAQNAFDLLSCRVTKARVSNVLSKLGVLSEKEFGKLLGAYTQDLIDEVAREDEVDVKALAGEEWRTLTTILKREMMPVLREAFVNQLEEKQ